MMVDHPVYYLGNLIIAKYLELTHGFKIWALISSEQDSKAVLTAKSFGVDGITMYATRPRRKRRRWPLPLFGILKTRQMWNCESACWRSRLTAFPLAI